jgi:hypothetical protein
MKFNTGMFSGLYNYIFIKRTGFVDSVVFWEMMRHIFLDKIQSFGEILAVSISGYLEDEASRIPHNIWSIYQRTILKNSEEKYLHIHSMITSNLTGFMKQTVMWGVLRATAVSCHTTEMTNITFGEV